MEQYDDQDQVRPEVSAKWIEEKKYDGSTLR